MEQTRGTSIQKSRRQKLTLEPESTMHKLLTISVRGVFEDLSQANENRQKEKPKKLNQSKNCGI